MVVGCVGFNYFLGSRRRNRTDVLLGIIAALLAAVCVAHRSFQCFVRENVLRSCAVNVCPRGTYAA